MLHQLLERTLQADPDRVLLEFHEKQWSAAQLEESSNRLASGLIQLGLQPIDRVAVLLPNRPETVFAYLACFKGNFVMVPLDYRHHAAQIRYSLNHSGADVLIVHRERIDELEKEGVLAGVQTILVVDGSPDLPYRDVSELLSQETKHAFPDEFEGDDLCVMIYTSGTTSRPKGVTLTRTAIMAGIKKYLARVRITSEDVALIAAPITRPMALRCQLLPVLYEGGRVSLIERFQVDNYVAALQRPPAKTFMALLPGALVQLISHPDIKNCDFSALRMCIAGGDKVPHKLHESFHELTGVALTEQCGSSEVGAYALNPPFGRKKQGSIGLPMYGAQVCVVDEAGGDIGVGEIGEIVVSSPLMMDGYWNDTALTRKTLQDGWVRTGDLGRFDDDGYLWFMGRKKDIIVCGGSNVSPLEVESILLNHPSVSEACVFGVTELNDMQEIHAFVTLHAKDDPVSEEELIKFASEHLAEYMIPKSIHFTDELPRKGAGKIDRERLRLRIETGVDDL
jgi:long-chain acyl-CoA synthetase